VGSLSNDITYALRMIAKNPGFAAVAILTLALGIGATTAIFSVVNTVLLEPLPFPDPDRIVQPEQIFASGDAGPMTSVTRYNVWSEQTQVFSDMTLYSTGNGRINLTGGDRPEQLTGLHCSANFFHLFAANMAQGRPFTADEDIPNGPSVVVISNGLWRTRYSSDPNLVGKNIEIAGQPFEVVGILNSNFQWDPPTDIFLPIQEDPNSTDQANYLFAAARLKPGVSLRQAQAAMGLAAAEFSRKFPGMQGPKQGFTADLMKNVDISDIRPALFLLLGTVAFVLLIACANVANLLLARSAVRQREIAIRAALGATRRRIIYQLLTESVLLSLAGGALGLWLGHFGVRALLAINPGNIPRVGEKGVAVTLDWRVLAFTLLISIATGILFGLIPAIHASRTDLNVMLNESGARSGTGFHQNKARSLLVVVEMALALILLAGSALLIRTYIAMRTVAPGFDRHNVLTMKMEIEDKRFQKTAAVAQLERNGVQRIEALPGAEAAATMSSVPLEPSFGLPFTIEGRALTDGPYHGGADWRAISPEYFRVFRVAILRGRDFAEQDSAASTPVVIINEDMAHKFWPQSEPLGERITIGKNVGPEFAEGPRQIVGIAGDVRDAGLDRDIRPIMYVPVSQVTDGITQLTERIIPLAWAVRTKVSPYSLSEPVQRELRAASGGLPVGSVRSMDQVMIESTARQDFNTTLLTIFAGIALVLAAIGVYGLMAYVVQQRKQEIGIRMALGAAPGRVRNMVVGQGMILALVGIVLGVASALGLTRLMAHLIFGIKTWDPIVFVSVTIVLSAAALFATYLPARRASRVDPLIALRYE
jgi:putative ABC transport system permease protein